MKRRGPCSKRKKGLGYAIKDAELGCTEDDAVDAQIKILVLGREQKSHGLSKGVRDGRGKEPGPLGRGSV